MMDRNFGYDWKNSKINRRFKQHQFKGYVKMVAINDKKNLKNESLKSFEHNISVKVTKEKSYQKKIVLSEQEVSYYYTALKNETLLEQMTIPEKQVLFEKGWSTLKTVMRSLFLQKEFKILQNGY